MFILRSLLNSVKPLTEITKKIFMVIVVFGIIFGVFISVIDKNRVVLDPQKQVLSQRAEIYSTLNQLNKKGDQNGALAYKTFNCITMGEACTDNPADGDQNNKNSVIGMVTGLIALPYINPPASGTMYALEKFNDAGIFPNTYAAEGLGFSSLKIFQPIWEVFRNLTFLLLVVIIVVIGFMIMFRMKLDPHTVVSLENALPKIILTMVLITFSYAIAGFLIDLMYVSVILVINVLAKPGGYSDNINTIVSSFLTHDLLAVQLPNGWGFGSLFAIYFNGIYAILDILPPLLRGMLNIIIGFIAVAIILRTSNFLTTPLASLFGKFEAGAGFIVDGHFEIGSLLGFLVSLVLGFFLSSIFFSLIISIIVLLGLVLLLLRIFFVLLAAYIQILVHILFAPLLLLMEAIPGQQGFMPWVRNLVGNLSVFPVTIALLLIIYVINLKIGNVAGFSANGGAVVDPTALFGTQYGNTNNQQMFLPPLMVLTPQAFLAVIDAAFLVMIPDLLKLVKQKIIGKEAAALPVGPGALISGSVGGVVGGGIGMFSQFGSFSHALSGVGGIMDKFKPKPPTEVMGPPGPHGGHPGAG
jgi:hypothetical protein